MIEIKQVKVDKATTFVSTSQSNSEVVVKVVFSLNVSFDPIVWLANSSFDNMVKILKLNFG